MVSKHLFVSALLALQATTSLAKSLKEQNDELFSEIQSAHSLSDEQMTKLKVIFEKSGFMGQGNPAVTEHPMTPKTCEEGLAKTSFASRQGDLEKHCNAKFMAPLYDPTKESAEQAGACIDQFEFPNIPCTYPVVWVRAKEAAEICEVMGKRLCDAHEWEGACEGRLTPADYDFSLAKKMSPEAAIRAMRKNHNAKIEKTWSYGKAKKKGICAMNSFKHKDCNGGNWKSCGSNTYPTGSYPDCKSSLEVYDIHGNAAEHMNLPLTPEQMASVPGTSYGHTEMKGSWFIFDKYEAHPDHCRWRAPYWHGTKLMDSHSHHNYHLGFRCCKSLGAKK